MIFFFAKDAGLSRRKTPEDSQKVCFAESTAAAAAAAGFWFLFVKGGKEFNHL